MFDGGTVQTGPGHRNGMSPPSPKVTTPGGVAGLPAGAFGSRRGGFRPPRRRDS